MPSRRARLTDPARNGGARVRERDHRKLAQGRNGQAAARGARSGQEGRGDATSPSSSRISSYPRLVCGMARCLVLARGACSCQGLKGGAMYHWMDGGSWFWMSFMMVFWVVVLGAVVYVAIKLANRPPTHPKSRS